MKKCKKCGAEIGDHYTLCDKCVADFRHNNNEKEEENKMIGKYVIVRGDRSGVFAGELVSQEGQFVELRNVRRLWRWYGATECLQIATEGVTRPRDCRFTLVASSIAILDAIEVIPTTEKSESCIKAVPVWKM